MLARWRAEFGLRNFGDFEGTSGVAPITHRAGPSRSPKCHIRHGTV